MGRRLRDWLRRWPKIDLHRHLEGTVRFETAWRWAQTNSNLADVERDELRTAVQFDGDRSFAGFLAKFLTLRKLYTDREAIEQVAYEAVEDASHDNVRYLELRFSPEHFAEQASFSMDDVATWVMESGNAATSDFDVTVRYILTIGRNYSPDHAAEILAIGLRHRNLGVVGVDLAGDEVQHPHPPFEQLYARAREEGLGVTIHAGEAGTAGHVRDAITRFSAHRIGHGIRCIDDAELMQTLRELEIALEVCPTSNLHTGVVNSPGEHPLPDLLHAGVPLVLCSDDPRISDITLTDEWVCAVTEMGLSIETLADVTREAVGYAFLPAHEKDRLRDQISAELGAHLTNVPPDLKQYTG